VDAALDVGAGFSRPFTATGVPVGGPDGSDVTLTTIATDAAGNVGQAALTLHVDRTPPVITITSPEPGDYVSGPVVTVSGVVSDASAVTVTLGGDVVVVGPKGVFSGEVQVADGETAIAATAVDQAGNTATAQVTVNVDSIAPQVTITSPADGLITSVGEVEVTGKVADDSPVIVRVNFVEVPVTNGAFAYTVGLLMEGAAALVVEATDQAGHTSSATVTVTSDRTPPVITITSPGPSVVIGNLPITVSGTSMIVAGQEECMTDLMELQGFAVACPVIDEVVRFEEGGNGRLDILVDGDEGPSRYVLVGNRYRRIQK